MNPHNILTLLLAALLWTGCTEDTLTQPATPGTPGDGRLVTVPFTFTPSLSAEVEVGTRATVDGIDEDLAYNLWVLQYSADGSKLLRTQYITGITNSQGETNKVEIELMSQASHVHFLANVGDSDPNLWADCQTEAKFLNAYRTVTNQTSVAVNGGGILMSGLWEGTPDDRPGAAPIEVSFTRCAAKVTLYLSASLPTGDSYTLTSATMKQVPSKLYYNRSSADFIYPTMSSSADVMDYPAKTLSGSLTSAVQTHYFFLPENARGIGYASKQEDKNAANAPTGQGSYCTYLEVKGTYTNAALGTIMVTKYRIFLGADNTRDYNIKRNTNYTLNVTIKGQYALDTRMVIETDTGWYTDHVNGWFMMAKDDVATDVSWDVAKTKCPAGWRIPTKAELALMAAYDCMPNMVAGKSYWGESLDDNRSWGLCTNMPNYVYPTYKDELLYLRCVKGFSSSVKKYPYTDGSTIVSRDAGGGVKSAFLTNVAPKLRVADADIVGLQTWDNAKAKCAAGGWRLPTKEELMLISVMNNKLQYPLKGGIDPNYVNPIASYWSGTECDAEMAWHTECIGATAGATYAQYKITTYGVRCVTTVD